MEILCYICYIISWVMWIPAIIRVIKRKSSVDYSLSQVVLEILYNVIWLAYVCFNPAFELIVCAVIDVLITVPYTIIIFKYHKESSEN